MPPQDKNTPDAPETPPETPAATPPAASQFDPKQFVSREDFNEGLRRMETMMAQFGGQLQGMASRPAAPAAPPPREYTDAELSEMLESGEGQKILAAQRIIAQQQLRPVVDEFVTFRSATMLTAESLGRDVVEAKGLIPHYKDPEIKRQIDAFLTTLPPEARANRESIILAHNYVVAQPQNLDRIVTARVEEEMRKRTGKPDAVDATSAGGRVPERGGSAVPTVTELLGESAARALRNQGRSADDFAKRMGYKTWAAYADEITKQQQGDAEIEEEV